MNFTSRISNRRLKNRNVMLTIYGSVPFMFLVDSNNKGTTHGSLRAYILASALLVLSLLVAQFVCRNQRTAE